MSDNYKICHENIRECNKIITADLYSWMQSLKNIAATFSIFANNPKFTGKSANVAKEYIREVYVDENNIPFLLCNIMQAMTDRMKQYEERMHEYDGNEGFIINSTKMEKYREDINKTRSVLYETNDCIKSLLDSISDIETPIGRPQFSTPSLDELDAQVTNLNKYIDNIHTDIYDIESDEKAYWSEITTQLENLNQLIETVSASGPVFGEYNGQGVRKVLTLILQSDIKIAENNNAEGLNLVDNYTVEAYEETEAKMEEYITP